MWKDFFINLKYQDVNVLVCHRFVFLKLWCVFYSVLARGLLLVVSLPCLANVSFPLKSTCRPVRNFHQL